MQAAATLGGTWTANVWRMPKCGSKCKLADSNLPRAQECSRAPKIPLGFPIFTYELHRVPQAITAGPVLKDGAGIFHLLD